MKISLLLLLAILGSGPVHAQSIRGVTLSEKSCRVADATLGTEVTDNAGSVSTNPTGDFKSFGTVPSSIMAGARGVVDLGASFFFPDTAAREMPPVQFNLKSIGSVPRPLDARQLTLVVDDTITMVLGSMTAHRQNWPGSDVVENLAVIAPTHRLTQLVRGKKVAGLLGQSRFTVSERVLKDLRALLVAGLCYASREE